MFKVIDLCGYVHEAYGTFIDENGTIQFILCDSTGKFYKTDFDEGFYELYEENTVSVTRCKDCAVPHNRWTGCPKLNGLVTPPDFYCSYGERRK